MSGTHGINFVNEAERGDGCRLAAAVTTLLTIMAMASGGGCSSGEAGGGTGAEETAAAAGPIMLDGDLGEWPSAAGAIVDDEALYFRLSPAGHVTLQSSRECHELVIDLDGSAETGAAVGPMAGESPAAGRLGAELVIRFAPTALDPYGGHAVESAGRGVAVTACTPDGACRAMSHAAVGLVFAPTYAASAYEARLSRALLAEAGLLPAGVDASRVRSRVLLRAADNTIVGSSEVSGAYMRMGEGRGEAPASAAELAAPPGTLRVVTYNVLLASPEKNPTTFARVFAALRPDIVLVQEWEGTSAEGIAEWFNTYVRDLGPWSAVASQGWGVAVVSRHPLTRFGPERLARPDGSSPDAGREDRDRPVRFAGAMASTPFGNAAVASVHLKCCGSFDSREEVARRAEAVAINRAVSESLASLMGSPEAPAALVIGGDMNLVGGREPLAMLGSAADLDGSDLGIAQPMTAGDRTMVTWSNATSQFSPGRLDYVVYSDSSAAVARAFVLETAVLSPEVLGELGLERDDCRGSDHLPVVVDLILR